MRTIAQWTNLNLLQVKKVSVNKYLKINIKIDGNKRIFECQF